MTERCPRSTFCDIATSNCYFLDNIRYQAENGAYTDPECQHLEAGPYWKDKDWTSLRKNALIAASAECPKANEVIFELDQITELKEQRNEII